MNKINFFFDIDGTILPFGKGIPSSALSSLLKAKEEGHRLFLSSGRSVAEIDPRLSVLPLSGGVFSAGATVIYENKKIFERSCTIKEKDEFFSYVDKTDLMILYQSEEGTYLRQETLDFFVESLKKYIGRLIDIPNLIISEEIPKNLEIKKFLVLSKSGTLDKVRNYFNNNSSFSVVDNTVGLPQNLMAEIVLSDITKATGIKKILDYLGEDKKYSVAIGDGANDIEMVQEAGVGIAMGNASKDLKHVASFITSDIEEDGLKNAIEYAIKKLNK